MSLYVSIAVILGLLVLWRLAWRKRPILAFGITIGILAGWVLAAVIELPSIDSIPVWLPPLPFAIVAVTLFAFGILAWVWDDDKGAGHARDTPPHAH